MLKARQVGMSQTMAIEATHHAAYEPGSTTLMVSRSLEAATNLLRYVKLTLPVAEPLIRLVKDAETEVVFSNQSRIKSVAASRSTGRSYAASHVYLDEFAFMPWALEIYQSVLPTVSRGGSVTVLSTPYGQQNPFAMLWQGQLGGSETWSRHTIPWSACPEFDQAWYERTRPQFTAAQWASEYACDFIESGQSVFRPEDIAQLAPGWLGLQPAIIGHCYVTAWDIGRRHDATVGITLDCTGDVHHIVAYERLVGVPYPRIGAAIEARTAAYPGLHVVESNGVGDPVIEHLDVRVTPFVTTAKSKVQAITALQKAVEQQTLKHDIEQVRQEQQVYQWDDDDLTQDCVMALAIAEHHTPRGGQQPTWATVEQPSARPIASGYDRL